MMNRISLFATSLIITLFMSCQTDVDYSNFEKAPNLNAKIEGFEVQEILKGEGEWLSLTLDHKGRFLTSPRYGKLLRIDINNGQGKTQVDTVDVGIYDCQGLLHAFDHLYMMGQNEDKVRGVYRLPQQGDGYGEPELLMEYPRNGDHSGHTLALGPDNMIYFLSGNDNKVPDTSNVEWVHKDWEMDHPMILESFFGVHQLPPGGFVMRTDSIGSEWQMYAGGLRNPYDMCFSPTGELFTYDSDMEWDFNLPWYRPTRVNHIVSGGDYAWRMFNAKRYDHYPDVTPAVVDFGRGSPTATTFGAGTAFPEKYQNALFAGDWSYGRIYAVHLTEKGGSYEAEYEVFVDGKPLNITDMVVGPDGALYFVTGGNGTDTGMFRVVWNGERQKIITPNKSVNEIMQLRRRLEAYHFNINEEGIALAEDNIKHEDRFVRQAARIILEKADDQHLVSILENANSYHEWEAAIVGLIRKDSTDIHTQTLSNALISKNFQSLSETEKLSYLRLVNLFLLRDDSVAMSTKRKLENEVLSQYPSSSPALDKEMSRTLAHLNLDTNSDNQFVQRTIQLLESTDNPVQLVHYLEVLRHVPGGWTNDTRKAFLYWSDYAGDNFKGGSLFQYFITAIKKDFQSHLSGGVMAQLNRSALSPLDKDYDGSFQSQAVARVQKEQDFDFVKNWKYDDLEYSLELVNSPRSTNYRDWHRGYRMLEKGQCYNCHQMLGRGGAYGPEITLAGNSFNAGDLLTSIIEPSQAINSRFQATLFNLKNDDIAIGRIINETSSHYVIQTDWTGDNKEEIPKDAVASTEPSDVSEMPTGLLNNMGRDEILDLLYFITEIPSRINNKEALDIFESQKYAPFGDSIFVEVINYSNEGDVMISIDEENYSSYSGPFYVSEPTTVSAYKVIHNSPSDTVTRRIQFYNDGVNGLAYKLYKSVDEPFSGNRDAADMSGTVRTFSTRDIVSDLDNFELHINGYLDIGPGEVTIGARFDDALKLFVDGDLIIAAPDRQWGADVKKTITLPEGRVPIKAVLYDKLSLEFLEVYYERDGVKKVVSANEVFLEREDALSSVDR